MEDSLKSRSDVSVVLIFFIALTILGVIGAGYAVNDYARARASAGWPVYEGVVLSRRGVFAPLRYVYSVNGRSYESGRVRFLSGMLAREGAVAAAPGETLTVYVDPDNHAFSVLAPGGAGAVFVAASILTGACVFLGVGGIVRTLTVAAAFRSEEEGAAAF